MAAPTVGEQKEQAFRLALPLPHQVHRSAASVVGTYRETNTLVQVAGQTAGGFAVESDNPHAKVDTLGVALVVANIRHTVAIRRPGDRAHQTRARRQTPRLTTRRGHHPDIAEHVAVAVC